MMQDLSSVNFHSLCGIYALRFTKSSSVADMTDMRRWVEWQSNRGYARDITIGHSLLFQPLSVRNRHCWHELIENKIDLTEKDPFFSAEVLTAFTVGSVDHISFVNELCQFSVSLGLLIKHYRIITIPKYIKPVYWTENQIIMLPTELKGLFKCCCHSVNQATMPWSCRLAQITAVFIHIIHSDTFHCWHCSFDYEHHNPSLFQLKQLHRACLKGVVSALFQLTSWVVNCNENTTAQTVWSCSSSSNNDCIPSTRLTAKLYLITEVLSCAQAQHMMKITILLTSSRADHHRALHCLIKNFIPQNLVPLVQAEVILFGAILYFFTSLSVSLSTLLSTLLRVLLFYKSPYYMVSCGPL